MVRNNKFFHIQVKNELYLRIQEAAFRYRLSMSQLLRHLIETSLQIMDVGNAFLPLPPSPKIEVKESTRGRTIILRNVEYTVGEK